MQEVPEEELSVIAAVSGVGGATFLGIELATTTSRHLSIHSFTSVNPASNKVSKVADIPEKEMAILHT